MTSRHVSTPGIRRRLLALVACGAAVLAAGPAAAQVTATWTGTTGDMATASNWSTDAIPSATAGDTMRFDGSGVSTLTFPGTTFSGANTTTGLGGLLVTGSQAALSITNAGPQSGDSAVFRLRPNAGVTIQAGAGAFSFGDGGSSFFLNLGASGSNRFTNDSSNVATIGPQVSIHASSGTNGQAIFAGSGDWLVSGAFTSALSRGLVKEGAGRLTLSGSNAFSGGTTISAGTVVLSGGPDRLGTAGLLTLANAAGANLDLAGNDQRVAGVTGGGDTGGWIGNSGEAQATLTLAPTADLSFAGRIEGDIRVVVGGTSNLALTPRQRLSNTANTYTGGTVVSGNALFVSSDGSLGAVPASLDPVNITLENGGVLVNNSTVLALDANRGIRIGPGGGGVAAGFNQNITFNGPISGGADDTVTIITNNGTVIWNADNTFAGRLVVQGEAGRLQVGSGGTTGTLGTGPVEIGAGGQITFNRAGEILVPNVISGGGNILKDGSGTVTLAAANTFTGTTSVSAGTLLLGDGAALGSGGATITSGTLDLGGQTIINSVVVNGGTLTGGTIDTSQVTPTAGTITATLSGTGNLVKAGGGQLIIRGTQTYAGETIIQSGTIQLGGGANPSATRQLPIGTVVTVNSGATLQVSGLADDTTNNEIVGGLQGDGIVNSPNTATNARLTIRNDADFTFNGSITSATNRLLLFKEGTGTQTLTGASTTVGQWTITAGTLRIENNTALGATAGNTLIGNAAVLALAGGISSAEPLVLSGRDDAAAATRIANAGETNTLTGGVTLNAGGEHYGLRSDSGNLRVQGTIARGDATGARTLRLGGTAAGEIAGGINGAGFTLGLVKEDAGIWTIAGTSSHTGPTTVTAGTLLVNGSLANTSAVTVQAGVLGGSGSLGAPLAGAGLVSPGNSPGILTAPAVSPSAGTGYAFEFTSPGSPAYGSRTASINDVLRLTDLATPFTTALTSANVIDIYFDVATLTNGDTFRGGFYTDLGADFLSSIAAADYAYWVRGDGFGGDRSFGGQSYYSLASFTPGFSVTLSTVAESADFGSGTIDGQVLQLVIVPEPGSLALAGLALATLAAARTARRRITVVRPAVRYHGVFAPNHKLRRAITALAIGNVGKRRDAATGGYAVG